MEVLMLTHRDWANTGWRFMRCLKLLGLETQFYKGFQHKFGYPEQAPLHKALRKGPIEKYPIIVNASELAPLVDQAKVIHFTASTFINTGADLGGKHVVVQHGGSTFRKMPAKVNKVFNPMVDATIIQCPDLLGLGAKNEVLIYYPVDTALLKPDFEFRNKNKILIGHFPSTAATKGTSNIIQAIKTLEKNSKVSGRFKYVGDTRRVPWPEQLERMNNCDILIETCNLKFDGRNFGEWGNTAIEAASLGKVVVTNTLTAGLYEKEYGQCALNTANNVKELVSVLTKLISLSRAELLIKKQETRQWVVNNHSLEANAIRLWEKVYCNFFQDSRKEEIENKVEKLKTGGL